MRAGSLQHRVEIQHQTGTTRSAIGEEIPSWTVFAIRWASIEPLRGNEFISLRMQGSELTTRIKTRYLDGVKAAMRVVHGTDVYNIIEAYSPFAKKRDLEMLCIRDAD